MLRILPLGGWGKVTQNMYLYEYQNEILIVDCGIGFPDHFMPGVDILLPDVKPLLDRLESGAQIVGLVLTHGHDDHIAATGYLLPNLPDFSIFASPLTAGFASDRIKEGGIQRDITVLSDGQPVQIGTHFKVESLAVTHSVPDTKHFAITTPQGVVYHGTDFKLDDHPVDGKGPDYEKMKQLGEQGLLLAALDCLRVEMDEPVPSESSVGPAILEEMKGVAGKVVVTMMSSHIHRIQQTVDAAQAEGRKIVFVGRSVEQNIKVATQLGLLKIKQGGLFDKTDINEYRPDELCIIIAGSQGQEGSSLIRAVMGEHREVKLSSQDKVIFSADAIPGNEVNFYAAIDELARQDIEVAYPAINSNLHQSGHGSAPEQRKVLELLKPKFVMPIGGSDRHRRLFLERVAQPLGYQSDQVLRPDTGEVLGVTPDQVKVVDQVSITAQTVDGKGVGDVGPLVLSDRRAMGEAGVIVLVIPRQNKDLLLNKIHVVSRGFVFMGDSQEVIKYIKDRVAQIVSSFKKLPKDGELARAIDKRLSRSLYKIIQREPVVLTEFVDI